MASLIEKEPQYMEGYWAAERIVPNIEQTNFKSLEGAVIHKSAIIHKFEEDFGYTRDKDNEDPEGNYAYNCGMVDAFIKAQEEK